MNIEYVARNFEIDDRLRGFAQGKIQKIAKFLEEPVEVRVTLEQEKHRHIAELHLTHRFGLIQANEETGDMFDAVHLAVDKAEKQARRSRKRYFDRRRKADRLSGHQWPVDVLDSATVGTGSTPKIVKSSVLSIKPMTIEEAALQLESSKNGFVVFRDPESESVHVLYRRKDDNYGLIVPE